MTNNSKKQRIFSYVACTCLISSSINPFFCSAANESNSQRDESLNAGIEYLISNFENINTWNSYTNPYVSQIGQSLDYLYSDYYKGNKIVTLLSDYYDVISNHIIQNNDDLSIYLIINNGHPAYEKMLLNSQNPDGGFGLAEGYASDIIDTKLALKALEDIGETEAMTGAACYIASLQNEDGGF